MASHWLPREMRVPPGLDPAIMAGVRPPRL
jgi:hypothetical protein